MAPWNDTDTPLAYLITFRTYGTWLPGDERGSIDRFHNRFQGPRVEPNPGLVNQHLKKLKSEPVKLNAAMRRAVSEAITEVCSYRKWTLWAANVRTNHAHSVVTTLMHSSDRVLNDLKSYATRKMRERRVWSFEHSPWVDKGSRRNLWTEEHIYNACNYVNNAQGDDLPDFL